MSLNASSCLNNLQLNWSVIIGKKFVKTQRTTNELFILWNFVTITKKKCTDKIVNKNPIVPHIIILYMLNTQRYFHILLPELSERNWNFRWVYEKSLFSLYFSLYYTRALSWFSFVHRYIDRYHNIIMCTAYIIILRNRFRFNEVVACLTHIILMFWKTDVNYEKGKCLSVVGYFVSDLCVLLVLVQLFGWRGLWMSFFVL